jgi:hypothetical protein
MTIEPIAHISGIHWTAPDGIHWLQVLGAAGADTYPHYKSLPAAVKRGERYYERVSFNSDTGSIWYKEVSESELNRPV